MLDGQDACKLIWCYYLCFQGALGLLTAQKAAISELSQSPGLVLCLEVECRGVPALGPVLSSYDLGQDTAPFSRLIFVILKIDAVILSGSSL